MPETLDGVPAERLARIETTLHVLVNKADELASMAQTMARVQERSEQHRTELDLLFERMTAADKANLKTDGEVQKWVNRGWGAYFAAAILLSVFGALLWEQVKSYQGFIRTQADQLVALERRITWLEFEAKGHTTAAQRPENSNLAGK